MAAMGLAFASPATADSSIGALSAQRAALQAQVNQLGAGQSALLEHLLEVQDRLADLRRQVSRNRADLASLEARRDDLSAQVAQARQEMSTQRGELNALARTEYKTRDQMGADQVFFGSSNFNDVVNRIVANQAMSQRAHVLLTDLRGVEARLAAESADLARRQAEIARLQAELADRQSSLQATADDYHAQLDALNASSAALLGQIKSIDAQIAAASLPPRGRYTPSQQEIIAIIRAAAQRYGVSGDQMVRVAECESGLNPRAYDPYSGASGLFQFMPGTFYANGGHDIWDPTDQSNVAAKMFSEGKADSWSCR